MCLKEVLKDIGVSEVNVSSGSRSGSPEDGNSHADTSSSHSSGGVIFHVIDMLHG